MIIIEDIQRTGKSRPYKKRSEVQSIDKVPFEGARSVHAPFPSRHVQRQSPDNPLMTVDDAKPYGWVRGSVA